MFGRLNCVRKLGRGRGPFGSTILDLLVGTMLGLITLLSSTSSLKVLFCWEQCPHHPIIGVTACILFPPPALRRRGRTCSIGADSLSRRLSPRAHRYSPQPGLQQRRALQALHEARICHRRPEIQRDTLAVAPTAFPARPSAPCRQPPRSLSRILVRVECLCTMHRGRVQACMLSMMPSQAS